MPINSVKSYLNLVFDFALPRLCVSCNTNLSIKEKIICSNCSSLLTLAPEELVKNEFKRKFRNDKLVSDFKPLYIFEENSVIRDIIHSLKYEQRYQIGEFLGNQIAEKFREQILLWNPDLIIPIPLHILKKAERGFNQSEKISDGIGKTLSLSVEKSLVKRKRFTQTQTKLSFHERKKNMHDAFQVVKKGKIKDKNIILADDVITTGATVSECARVLKNNGAGNIYALSVAIAE